MGLPLFITPKEPQASAKSPEKMVAVPRSAIRRRPIPRRRNSSSSMRRRLLGSLEHSREEAYQIWERQARPTTGEAEFAPIDGSRARARRVLDEERLRIQQQSEPGRGETGSDEVDGLTMPAVPDVNLASHQERLRTSRRTRQSALDQNRRMARRHAAPTPPYHDHDLYALDYVAPPPPRLSSLTPVMSPFSGDISPRRALAMAEMEDAEAFALNYDTHLRSSLNERMQALNRASDDWRRSTNQFRQARILRQATLDGLGDRNRSLSPDNGAGAWDTLLTSITPDPQPPSVGSSFVSTSAAAATASSSNSVPSSASTSMTSLGATQAPAMLDCDISDDSNTDEDDEEDIYELHEFAGRRGRGNRAWTTYADVVVPESMSVRRNLAEPEQPEHLDGMHRIISRLAERDEIPDEWWTSAGLSRNLRREPST